MDVDGLIGKTVEFKNEIFILLKDLYGFYLSDGNNKRYIGENTKLKLKIIT